MATDDLETEFFGSRRRISRPRRSERGRAEREQRSKREPLRSAHPAERVQGATTLVEEGTEANALVLLEFVREERNRDVRTAVARAVLAAPVGPDPDRPEAKLRDWARAEATRHGDAPPAREPAPPPLPLASPAPEAAAPPAAPVPVSGRIPAAVSPDDRWRAGGFAAPRPRPGSAPAAAAPVSAAAVPPAVVGGTVGNGSGPTTLTREADAPLERPVPEAAPVAEPPAPARPAPSAPEDSGSPNVTPAPDDAARPDTWRVVKAHPVDIVVWGPAAGSGEPTNGEGETARRPPSAAR